MNKSGELPTYAFDQLAIWKTQLPNAKHAILPPSNNRPNPLVGEDILYISVFSEGAVCALDRKSGALLWRKAISKLGGSSVQLAGQNLFAKTANTLFALDPQTGRTIWYFCPYGESGESIYSSPTVAGNRLFIGDRCGYLHCLDARTGEILWRKLTSTEERRDVNSTPIIVGTNAGIATAYDMKSGRQDWTQRLDGASVFGPLLFQDLAVLVTDSIHFLNCSDGNVVSKFSWKGDSVTAADCTLRGVVCILRGPWPPKEVTTLVSLDERGIRYTKTFAAYVGHLRFARETNSIYISHFKGIDILREADGAITCKIALGDVHGEIGPVDVGNSTIYAQTGDGYVYALRHPLSEFGLQSSEPRQVF